MTEADIKQLFMLLYKRKNMLFRQKHITNNVIVWSLDVTRELEFTLRYLLNIHQVHSLTFEVSELEFELFKRSWLQTHPIVE